MVCVCGVWGCVGVCLGVAKMYGGSGYELDVRPMVPLPARLVSILSTDAKVRSEAAEAAVRRAERDREMKDRHAAQKHEWYLRRPV